MIVLRNTLSAEQKEFARKDYLGLTVKQANLLKSNRRSMARELAEDRNTIADIIGGLKKKNLPKEEINNARRDFYKLELDELNKRKKLTRDVISDLTD